MTRMRPNRRSPFVGHHVTHAEVMRCAQDGCRPVSDPTGVTMSSDMTHYVGDGCDPPHSEPALKETLRVTPEQARDALVGVLTCAIIDGDDQLSALLANPDLLMAAMGLEQEECGPLSHYGGMVCVTCGAWGPGGTNQLRRRWVSPWVTLRGKAT